MAGVTFVTLLAAAGCRSFAGILIVPLQDEFGWSRATISLAVSVNLLLFGLGAPFVAALYERFGLRRVMTGALAAISVGAALTVEMGSPWHLYLLWGVMIGLGTGAVSVPLAAVVANRWFVTQRGLVTGLLTASNATGQLAFLPLLAWITHAFGWRYAAATLAIVTAGLVLPLVAVAARDRPEQLGLRPYGADEDDAPAPPAGNPAGAAIQALRDASHSRTFWILTASFFVCGASTNGLIGTHFVPAAHDHGFSQVTAASLLALVGIFDIVGTTASGWLTDRWDARKLLFWYYGLRGASLVALPHAFGTHAGLGGFVVFYGLDWVATVPPTVALTAQAFGRARVGVVFAWIFASHQLGAAGAAWAAGFIRSDFGSYHDAFMGAGFLCFAAAVLVLRMPRAPAVATPAEAAPVMP
jgi:predicted MFS family arabinose efflux permease